MQRVEMGIVSTLNHVKLSADIIESSGILDVF